MGIDIKHTQLFSVPIYEADIPNFSKYQEDLVKIITDLRHNNKGVNVSNSGGWHSENNLHNLENSSIKWLIQQICTIANQSIRHSNTMPNSNMKIILSSCWANVNEAGNWNTPHAHFPEDWSGVCYIKINENDSSNSNNNNDGNIIFFNPLTLGPQYKRFPTVSYHPQNGKIMLFPSYLVHMVTPHFDKDSRISLAFNFKFKI